MICRREGQETGFYRPKKQKIKNKTKRKLKYGNRKDPTTEEVERQTLHTPFFFSVLLAVTQQVTQSARDRTEGRGRLKMTEEYKQSVYYRSRKLT